MMQRSVVPPSPTPGRLLRHHGELPEADLSTLLGFGGLHGGLLVGLLTAELAADAEIDRPLRYVTAQFHRPATGAIELAADESEVGRSVTRARGRATEAGRTLVTAAAVFATVGARPADGGPPMQAPVAAPPMPAVAPPERCEPFVVPVEFVPFTQHLDIRPTDGNLPFGGGTDPTLTAWIRLKEDDEAPDRGRLITLLDSLAPSYAAVIEAPVAIPTIELSVRLSTDLSSATSPWILLRASTHRFDGGWIDERIDAWTPEGTPVATGTQVRLLRP
ncbi:MAG: thioesterase family protein [Actinomycetota bacterium]